MGIFKLIQDMLTPGDAVFMAFTDGACICIQELGVHICQDKMEINEVYCIEPFRPTYMFLCAANGAQ